MSERRTALFTYDGLPLSSGGAHRLRGNDVRRTWEQLSQLEYGHQLPLGTSVLYLRLSERSTCSIVLSLPFVEDSAEFHGYRRLLQQSLPFKLAPRRWSRWQLNKAGTRYYSRKVPLS
jgi:hypothetical protein